MSESKWNLQPGDRVRGDVSGFVGTVKERFERHGFSMVKVLWDDTGTTMTYKLDSSELSKIYPKAPTTAAGAYMLARELETQERTKAFAELQEYREALDGYVAALAKVTDIPAHVITGRRSVVWSHNDIVQIADHVWVRDEEGRWRRGGSGITLTDDQVDRYVTDLRGSVIRQKASF